MAEVADMPDMADMADRANSRVILPTIAYIDSKSEIISHSLTDWLTPSTNCKEMLSHLKSEVTADLEQQYWSQLSIHR